MKIIGYRRADFAGSDGKEVTGNNVYVATDIDPRRGAGMSVERSRIANVSVKALILLHLLVKRSKCITTSTARSTALYRLTTDSAFTTRAEICSCGRW